MLRHHYDDSDDITYISEVQDVEPLLEENKSLQHFDGYSPSRELRRIGSVPTTVLMNWAKDDGLNFADIMAWPGREFAKWYLKHLRDPENLYFRTCGGSI